MRHDSLMLRRRLLPGLGKFCARVSARPRMAARASTSRASSSRKARSPRGGAKLLCDGAELPGLRFECHRRFVDALSQSDCRSLAVPNSLSRREARGQLVRLGFRRPPGATDLVGHILGRVGDDREVVPQLVHVLECRVADAGDRGHLLAIVVDEALKAVGMFGNPLACRAA